MLSDRRVLGCFLVAVAAAVLAPWLWAGDPLMSDLGSATYWGNRLLWVAPFAAALAAVLLTRRAVGVRIAVVARVLGYGSTVLWVSLASGATGIAVDGPIVGIFTAALIGLVLLPADLLALRRDRFGASTGALAGLAVGAALSVASVASDLVFGPVQISEMPFWYVGGVYILPLVLLPLTGLVAGRRSPAYR